MAKIIWTSSADDDIKMISEYISIDSEFYAEQVVDRIYQRVCVLEKHTYIGKIVAEFKDPSIRELREAPYRIIYKIENEDEIYITRIYHSARLLKSCRKRIYYDKRSC